MSSLGPVLREARSEVIPLVPDLAPHLPTIEQAGQVAIDAVQDELLNAVAAQGVDPTDIPPPDFNKLSRHTLAGGVVRLQRVYLVEGEGREAHFREDIIAGCGVLIGGSRENFARDLGILQAEGANYLRRNYTAGADSAHSWFPALSRRYWELGQKGLKITPAPPRNRNPLRTPPTQPIPFEGQFINSALTTEALSSLGAYMFKLVRKKAKGTEARREVAHDIAAQFLGGLASTHFYELKQPKPPCPHADLVKNEKTGRHTLRMTAKQKAKLHTRMDDALLPNARFKCAAHAMNGRSDTDMMTFAHAAINLAADEYDIL